MAVDKDTFCADICAIIITYQPQLTLLQQVVASVVPQVGQLLIFDNASDVPGLEHYWEQLQTQGVKVICSSTNVGVGAAINRAVEWVQQQPEIMQVLLLDQDSQPDAKMVSQLQQALVALQQQAPIAAVGPQFYDSRSAHAAPFVRIRFPLNNKQQGGVGQRVACDFLITSGSLIPLSSLAQVGMMDEGLFIDNVDLEWCFRAQAKGLQLYGICDATMRHCIGDTLRYRAIKPGGVIIHSPLRLYYIMRNRVLLYRRKETPLRWIAQDIPRLILKFFGTALFVAPRREYLRAMLQGLGDGIIGISGAMPSKR